MPASKSRSVTVTLAAAVMWSTALAAPAAAPGVSGGAHFAAKTLTISAPANGDTRFLTTRLSASTGTIVLRLRNPSGVPHAIALGSKSGSEVTDGGISRISVRLKKGRYTYYCPVGSHRRQGMKGTLTVR